MSKIALISCASKKLSYRSKVQDIYNSPLFKMNLRFARKIKSDKIFILSAKHGLIDLEEEIEPYNKTLKGMSYSERIKWAEDVLDNLKKVSDIDNDEFIFLAGKIYRQNLIPKIKNYKIPMERLGIGKQLQYLKRRVE